MATAFGTQGATPFNFGTTSQSTPSMATTPAGKALATPFNGGSTPNGLFSAKPATPPAPPAPSTPVKKTTVNNVDGSSHTTEYHAPETGLLNANAGYDSAAMATAPQGTPVQPTPQSSQNTSSGVTYPGLIGSVASSAQGNAAIGKSAADIGSKYAGQIADIGRQGASVQAGDLSTGTNVVGEGNAAIASQSASQRMSALAAAENAELLGTGQQLTAQNNTTTGLLGAGGLAAPIQVPYSNQIINPQTGESAGGGATGTLPASAQTFITSLAQQVKNGQMTRDEATSQLSSYGVAGLQALNAALGSDFNTNASNASAGTTATGQQIQTAASSTNQALDTLSSSFNSLPGWQTGTIPAGNSIAQWIGSQLGDAALTQYKTNLADARSQLIGVLNSAGGTPTGNEATAQQYLPDNMTPAQFQQNVGTAQNPGIVRQLIQQKVGSFINSGQQNNSNANSTTQPAGWL